jgi:hypothetical protein
MERHAHLTAELLLLRVRLWGMLKSAIMQEKTGTARQGTQRRWGGLAIGVRLALTGVPIVLSAVLLAGATAPANLDEALAAQRSLVAQDPSNADQLNDLGNLLVLANDLEGAEEAYRRALNLQPDSETSLYNLALVLQEQGRIKQARKAYQSILENNPDNAWCHYQLGTLDAAGGSRSKALDHFARAFSLDRSLADPKINPHVVENPLLTDALLRLYVSKAASSRAPRIYREPGNVAELLLPPAPEAPPAEQMTAQDAAPTADSRERQYRATYPLRPGGMESSSSPAEVEDPSRTALSSPDRDPDESSLRPGQADPGSNAPPGWSGTATTLQPGVQQGSSFAPDSPAPEVAAPPPVRRITAEDLRSGAASSEAETPPFVPATESTGRLEIELIPATDPGASVSAR